MRRLLLLVSGTAVAIVMVIAIRTHANPPVHHPAGRPSPTVRVALPSPSATRHAYHSGVATGAVARTDYGAVQVRVIVVRGRIVKVAALRLPHGNQMDVQLSKAAVRVLERRVISAQSANVDMVSGATYTSKGYLRSLQSALDRL
jgi:uncharacterized protein with FMN-binding domain